MYALKRGRGCAIAVAYLAARVARHELVQFAEHLRAAARLVLADAARSSCWRWRRLELAYAWRWKA